MTSSPRDLNLNPTRPGASLSLWLARRIVAQRVRPPVRRRKRRIAPVVRPFGRAFQKGDGLKTMTKHLTALCAAAVVATLLASCSKETRSNVVPALTTSAVLTQDVLAQVKALAQSQPTKARLPKAGEHVPANYGVPISHGLALTLRAAYPRLASGENKDTILSLITVPGKPKSTGGIKSLSAVIGVCAYAVTITYATWDHYVNGTLVTSDPIPGTSYVSNVTPLYCDDGYTSDDSTSTYNAVDCSVTPDDPVCSILATVAPQSGLSCDGSQYVLGTSNLPPNSATSSTVVNIWTFDDQNYVPMMWFYQTADNQIWAQTNLTGFPDLSNLIGSVPGINSLGTWLQQAATKPQPISVTQYASMKATMITSPYLNGQNSIHHCFTSSLSLV